MPPLKWLFSKTDLSGRPARWQMILADFNIVIKTKPGGRNENTEGMSHVTVKSVSVSGMSQQAHINAGHRVDENVTTSNPENTFDNEFDEDFSDNEDIPKGNETEELTLAGL
ncbi:hypothetical protein BGZ65_001285 [Modicella reniformis]|uniref:Uncharacterized protein n=1 Tax=Modicella reniformis TaxID=1440133 RepID=A0A9P6SU75_9FUNG|nr:hypothetical protein BGZ65_001285 [Modicella reniformis]